MYWIEAVATKIDKAFGFAPLESATLYQIAWSAAFISVLIAWAFAKTSALQNHPRHYAAMALFACTWMLVLPYYNYITPDVVQTTRERQAVSLASDIAAVLLVYIGGLTAASAQEIRPVKQN